MLAVGSKFAECTEFFWRSLPSCWHFAGEQCGDDSNGRARFIAIIRQTQAREQTRHVSQAQTNRTRIERATRHSREVLRNVDRDIEHQRAQAHGVAEQ